ncbi:MAG: glycoside hydrolase family 16 protein, partial [Clostridia bacterium]|nr:glycoside hydrolase family 16 protein [Clostridia bacterium]
MKKFLSIILTLLIVVSAVPMLTFGVSADANNSVGGFLDRVRSDFDLVFYDEFEGDTLDTTKWQYDGDATFRNSEAQIYANGPEDGNVYMEDGCVVLKAEKEERTSSSNGRTKQYTSGEISTHNLGAWKYGYFEFNAKLPKGNQVFPAIWLMGYDYETSTCDWPHSGEIDIMEALGGNSGENVKSTWSTLHHSTYGKRGSGSHKAKGAGTYENLNKQDMTNEFHKFWMYWTDEIIMLGIDEGCYNIIDITTPELAQSFREYEHWILFDLAMAPYGKEIVDHPSNEWEFYIDYARVYQLPQEDDYDNYKIVEAENTITLNNSAKSWSLHQPTNLLSDSNGSITSKIEGFENGTYDVYASYNANEESKSGVFDAYINGQKTSQQINTLSSTGKLDGAQGYLGRVTVKDDTAFSINLKRSSGGSASLAIDKYFFVKTNDTTGAIVSDKNSNANLYDEIEVSSANEFYNAFDNVRPGGTIKLKNDITLDKKYTISTDCVIDLNGYTLSSGTLDSVFTAVKSNIKVTFKNGKIQANGKNGTLGSFVYVSSNWDAHYITFEDVAVSSTAKTINSFLSGSWGSSNYTLKNCSFDFTNSSNDGSTNLYVIKVGDGWNAANTVLNNVTFNYKTNRSPICLTGEAKAFEIKNCTFNNCKNVIETAAALGANAKITLANCEFNNIGAFTTF